MDEYQDNMMSEDPSDDSQQQTQSTQQASQPSTTPLDSHLWGYLQPCSSTLNRIDFWRINPRYSIGRSKELNQVVLPGFKVSNLHCTITWDGLDTSSNVTVMDLSSNGTFINGSKIGKNLSRVLREGNEIAFGTTLPQPQNGGLEDYRFIYRHTAGGPPTSGLYAFYDLTQELGKGSFAVVMKAMSRQTGEWVAVKMIQESRNVRLPGEPQARSRNDIFLREVKILEKLRHRNICQLKEVFIQDESNDINLVLELVEGGDLLDYILKNNGLSEHAAQHITYQLCDALSYIHSESVTHRDLKPENVLLTKDNPPIVKVADFGLAKFVDSLTMLRTMCGTPSYLAPEVVKQTNNEGYDNLVDSWSVGVIVFSMLTNSGPFIEDEGQRDIRTRVSERRVQWDILTSQNISDMAVNFVRALLEEDPRKRMTLTDALAHDWLTSYTPPNNLRGPSLNSVPAGDFSMISEADDGIQDPSKKAPLQRSSHLILQAVEEGKPMPEPSWEMVANVGKMAETTNDNPRGAHKRVRSELTPLQEESMGEVTNEAGPSGDTAEREYSNSYDELYRDSPAVDVRAARKAAQVHPVDEQPQLRRSNRHPQKVARHF